MQYNCVVKCSNRFTAFSAFPASQKSSSILTSMIHYVLAPLLVITSSTSINSMLYLYSSLKSAYISTIGLVILKSVSIITRWQTLVGKMVFFVI